MTNHIKTAVWIEALQVEAVRRSIYPEPFKARVAGRMKRRLGEVFGLRNFGVNLVHLEPGSQSALRHSHTVQDEFVYVMEGQPTLFTDDGEEALHAGCCAGFNAGGRSHHLVNRTTSNVVYLEIGDRLPGDGATYPVDDLVAHAEPGGLWLFSRKDGSPY